jgi:hypothetical protein
MEANTLAGNLDCVSVYDGSFAFGRVSQADRRHYDDKTNNRTDELKIAHPVPLMG